MTFEYIKLTNKNKFNQGVIYARVRDSKKNKRYKLNIILYSTDWEKYLNKSFKKGDSVTGTNFKFGDLALYFEQVRYYFENNQDSEEDIKEILDQLKQETLNGSKYAKVVPKKKNITLLVDYIERVIKEARNGERLRLREAKPIHPGVLNNYIALRKLLIRFQNAKKRTISLEDVNMKFQRDFTHWSSNNGYSEITLNNKMEMIHTIMRMALEDNLTKNNAFMTKGFVPRRPEIENIYLTEEQIEQMYHFNLSSEEIIRTHMDGTNMTKDNREKLEKLLTFSHAKDIEIARDVFIVGCLTGQRFSDYSKFNNKMIIKISEIPFIRVVQQKTDKKILIPLDSRVKEILDKYNGHLPYIHQNYVNSYLKIIGELMGWTWEPELDESKLGRKKASRFCDMIATHTARRSFATNAYKAGVPLRSIMAITGHSREDKLRIYLKLQPKETAINAIIDFEGLLEL